MIPLKTHDKQALLQDLDRTINGLKVTVATTKEARQQIIDAIKSSPMDGNLSSALEVMNVKIHDLEKTIKDQQKKQSVLLRSYVKEVMIQKLSLRQRFADVWRGDPSQPPVLAEIITRWVTKPDLLYMVLDSRAERYEREFKKRGSLVARTFYWTDTLKSCWPSILALGRWLLAGEFVRWWFSH